MKYIVHRRFKAKALCGDVNYPAMTECEEINGMIYHDGQQVCLATSENSHQYFARNDDGNGMLRGKLTQAIQKELAQRDEDHQNRWNKIWDDMSCLKYKRVEHQDYWLWNHDFFGASIDDLKHIAELIGVNLNKI